MPPTRTIPPAKVVKTERTHEENQERAYIAASRRSDRSLEARVESARRASEIHKRRTGRSLRVTEQDVINEEMYEEEDDDLPLHYRRLTAHLQTNSADFNRRLTAYLTNQVAMRSAMDQMAHNPYMQQLSGMPPQYPPQRPNMFQSPMMSPHPMTQSPAQSYRQAPYPSPHHPGFRNGHGRAYSSAVVPTTARTPPTPTATGLDHRRMSTPAAIHPAGVPPLKTEDLQHDVEYRRQTQSAQVPQGQFPPFWQDMGPFTTSLPPESQLMLAGAPALDPNDPFSAALMHGSENVMSSPYYPWGHYQQGGKGMSMHPSSHPGMSTTLAPAVLDTRHEALSASPSTVAPPTVTGSASANGLDFGHGEDFHSHRLQKPSSVKREGSYQDLSSSAGTPGESFWNSFVHDGGWNEDPLT